MIKIVEDSSAKSKFNERANHPLQSWEWGEARKKMGVEVFRLSEDKKVFQLTLHKIPYTNYKIGYLPRSVLPSKLVLDFLAEYGKKNKVIFIKIEPYLFGNLTIKHSEYLVSSSHPLFPKWTQILDITPSEAELLKQMHHKTRYNIRLAEKKGVIVKEVSTEKGFELFQKLYFETTKRQKYYGHNYQYHRSVWENLTGKISHILIAFYNEIPLAAYQLFYFKDTVYYVYGGTSELHRNLMASNLLMWEAIKLGKKLGATKFDMWGSLPPGYSHENPWAGFTRFKEGYGGKFIQFAGSYDLVINALIYKIFNLIYNFRKILLKIKINAT